MCITYIYHIKSRILLGKFMSNTKSVYRWCIRSFFITLVLIPLSIQTVYASTFVQVNTSLGNFTLELLDSTAPGTVSNFLNYVNSGRYNGTAIHRVVEGFVIQGGWVTFDETVNNVSTIALDPNIVNEYLVSNTRGTIAMAKVGGDPDSANSQWFVNLGDNLSLNSSNGGFTVFGRVIDDGMAVVDAIGNLPLTTINGGVFGQDGSPFPLIDFDGTTLFNANFVNISMAVIPGPANYLEPITNLLKVKVDGGAAGIGSVAFAIVSTTPKIVIQLDLSSVVSLAETAADFATFNGTTGLLVIPQLHVDGVASYQNVVFQLTNAELFQFTFLSAD